MAQDEWRGGVEMMEELLKQAIAVMNTIQWRSADKDNMEFAATITYSQMDKVKAIAAKLDAALAQPPLRDAPEDWKKIESAPKDGVPFDAWAIAGPGDNGFRVANCWTDETGVRIPAGTMFNPFCTITHWRPIPSGPKERE